MSFAPPPTPSPVVVTRLEDGRLCATGMSTQRFNEGGISWDLPIAQMAMLCPEATALKPGESVTINLGRTLSS
jgi:hypothetical protein